MNVVKRYPDELRSEAVAAVERRRERNPADRTIFREVAEKFQVGEQSLRLWVKKEDARRLETIAQSNGSREHPEDDFLSEERLHSELVSLRRRIQKLQLENDLLKRAFVVFSKEWSEKE